MQKQLRVCADKQVSQRTLGVELVISLFDSFPEPFNAAYIDPAAAASAATPNGQVRSIHIFVPYSCVLPSRSEMASCRRGGVSYTDSPTPLLCIQLGVMRVIGAKERLLYQPSTLQR